MRLVWEYEWPENAAGSAQSDSRSSNVLISLAASPSQGPRALLRSTSVQRDPTASFMPGPKKMRRTGNRLLSGTHLLKRKVLDRRPRKYQTVVCLVLDFAEALVKLVDCGF